MNKPVYSDMAILDITKTLMYELWYDYIKLKYGGRAKLCYMDTDSFVIHIITKYFYKDIANDVERWFDYDENETAKRPLPIGINKKVIGLFKNELGGKILEKFCALRAKTYAYLINGYIDDDDYHKGKIINKKVKGIKKCVTKRRIMFENYKDSLFNDKIILKSQQTFKSDHHDVYTITNNKIALSSDDHKRLHTFDRITTYPHGTNAFKVCESEMLKVCEAKVTLKMLSKKCESEMYVKEKEKCEMLLKYVKAQCEIEMRKYVKVNINDKF